MKLSQYCVILTLAITMAGCNSQTTQTDHDINGKNTQQKTTQQPLAEEKKDKINAGIKGVDDEKIVTSKLAYRKNETIATENNFTTMDVAVTRVLPQQMTAIHMPFPIVMPPVSEWNRESYNPVNESGFVLVRNNPLSTFSIDVDTASYANIRRFINNSSLPPAGAVRLEEMINYFSYDYPSPSKKQKHPFSVTSEIGPTPWNDDHRLIKIGLKAKDIEKDQLPPSNLVFLIDVSGSMNASNKLPLMQRSMKMLVEQLDKQDRVSIVVYAGRDSILLEPTSGAEKSKIKNAIDSLRAGGSTHASSGILTAYKLAEQGFMPNGNNRIILASDGDFNVGVTSRDELQKLIEEKRETGIYLTVLGFGMGNYHDDTMEILANKGNGNYAYIDNLLEANKVMVKEMSGTMFALARDVKIQVEFNPAEVGAYRLIGYENRRLADEDFNDDKKDAGEIGVGHTVTALYEIIPADSKDLPALDPLKYQTVKPQDKSIRSNELMTVKLRYKPLDDDKSILMKHVIKGRQTSLEKTSDDFRFVSAVAGFGMLLQESGLSGTLDYNQVITLARSGRGNDLEGYRAEFIRMVEMADLLQEKK